MLRHTCLPIIAVSLLLASGFPCFGADYADGQKLYQQKDYRNAAIKFEAAMRANPRDTNAIYYCALAQQMSNNRARARQLYQYITTNFAGSPVYSMAQTALNQLGGVAAAGTGSSSSAGTSTMRGGNANSDPAYLSSLPDEIRVPLLRRDARSKAAYVEVSLNGHPIIFHVDTGAYSTTIGANQLEGIGLSRPATGREFAITGVGERSSVKGWNQKLDLKVGQIYRRDFIVTVQDYMDNEPLLGQDFLRDFNLTVDDSNSQVVFRKKNAHSAFAMGRGTMDIPYTIDADGRHMIVDTLVNGRQYKMYFDTGADGVCFSFSDFTKLRIPPPEGPPTGKSTGVMGSTNTWSYVLDSLKVGPVSKENFPVAVIENTKMDKPLLGQSFFGNYKYTVDSAKSVIHLSED
jgi:clan AA aspartic protease (TIGR02281 family)